MKLARKYGDIVELKVDVNDTVLLLPHTVPAREKSYRIAGAADKIFGRASCATQNT